ncbi:DsbA family protein [Herpetosiphon sp. NSE202]|uniref:DsbA family protein n=1 Tax=Herpetosiphon sp. NSE202 TaxID=3351349 RepID=UPI003643F2B7
MTRRIALIILALVLASCGSYEADTGRQVSIRPTIVPSTPAPPATKDTLGIASEFIPLAKPAQIPADDQRSLGDPNAPVTIVEYSDFQCPFCQRHHVSVFPDLKAKYIDTGKVRYVFRNYIAVESHTSAPAAGVASFCAMDQGKFWEMYDILFVRASEWGIDPTLAPKTMLKYAEELGLDSKTFAQCQADPAVLAKVNAETAEAVAAQATGTPAFFIGNYIIPGAYPMEGFDAAITLASQNQ